MRFAVMFIDNEEHADKRSLFMKDHLAFLDKNKISVLAAGPLTDAKSDDGVGGLWIVEAESVAVVQALVEEDPFYPTGLRKEIQIMNWKLVFEQGQAQA